jgi:hypothetical protein
LRHVPSSKLSKALRTKDFTSASVSQTWIETAQKKVKEATDRLNDIRNEQKSVESRKRRNLEKAVNVEAKKKTLGNRKCKYAR